MRHQRIGINLGRIPTLLMATVLLGTACEINVGDSLGGPSTSQQQGGTASDPAGTVTTTVADERTGEIGGTLAERDPAVEQLLAPNAVWNVPVETSEDRRDLQPDSWTVDKQQTVCEVAPARTISRTFDELAAFPFTRNLLPGLIIEGAGLVEPDLRPLALDRAPLRLNSTLDSVTTSIELPDPDPTALNEAVTALKRDADARLTGLDVVPADITYSRKEVHSYEEAMLDLGLSLSYDSGELRGKFESAFRQEQSKEKHSIAVQLVQPMFSLWVDRTDFPGIADHFDAGVGGVAVQSLIDTGRIGAENPPVLIDSVTYGRIMYFTMTSTDVASASELEVAVEAAWGGLQGGATLTERQQTLLSQSDTRVLAYGGDQAVAEAALKTGNLNEFFGSVNTTTAAPLSLTARTLDGAAVTVADEATVRSMSCGTSSQNYYFEVRTRNLKSAGVSIFLDGKSVVDDTSAESRTFLLDPAVTGIGGDHTVTVDFWSEPAPWPCLSSSLTVDILRDGQLMESVTQSWPDGTCWGELKWLVNAQTGQVRIG